MSDVGALNIPQTWTWEKIGSLGTWRGGGTPATDNAAYWNGGSLPWVSPKDMKTFAIHDAEDHITQAAVENSTSSELPPGSILMVTRSGILRHTFPVSVTRVPVAINQDLKALLPHEGISADYVAYALRCFGQAILHGCSKDGTTVQSMEASKLTSFHLPIAPTCEQVRITEALEELLSDLDAGERALERVREKLKLYRAAVLKAAVEGDLTAEWRAEHPDVEPASELLNRILAERRRRWEEEQLAEFEAKGQAPPRNWKAKYREPVAPDTTELPDLPEGWCWATVDQLIVSSIVNGISVRGSETPPGIPALKLSAMTASGLDYTRIRYLPLRVEDVDDIWIDANDFFVCRGNGSKHLVGRGSVASDPPFRIIFPDTMMRLRLGDRHVEPKWIPTIWTSGLVRKQIERAAKTTAGIYKISQPDVAQIVVPLPGLNEQEMLVELVEDQISIADRLDVEFESRIQMASALRQAILRHAFSGKLVPQDPNDEPASELLKRIAGEREARAEEAAAAKKGGNRNGRRGRPRKIMQGTN